MSGVAARTAAAGAEAAIVTDVAEADKADKADKADTSKPRENNPADIALSAKDISALVSRRLTILGHLVLLETAVLLSTPWWQPHPLGVVVGIALVITLGFAYFSGARSLRLLRLKWLGPDQAVAGEDTLITFHACHPDGCAGVVLDSETGIRGARQILSRLGDLNAGGVKIQWETRFSRRGWQRIPSIDALMTSPFGLIATRRTVASGQDILILPGRGLLRRELRRRLDPWMEQMATGVDAGDEEIARLRSYRPGDPPRRVHWRASARARQLLVAERHAPTARALALVLDTSQSSGLSPKKLDRLVAIAASFVDHLLRRGWQVTLHGPFAPTGISGDRRVLLETLALLTRDTGDTPLESCIPRGRAAIVISVEPPEVSNCRPQPMLLSLSECEQLVRLPRRLGV